VHVLLLIMPGMHAYAGSMVATAAAAAAAAKAV
jgi:hypothetical protein